MALEDRFNQKDIEELDKAFRKIEEEALKWTSWDQFRNMAEGLDWDDLP